MLEITLKAPDFALAEKEMDDLSDFTKAVAAMLKSKRAQDRSRGVDPYGDAYSPLTAAYLKQKLKAVGNKQIMVRTGATWASYTQKISRDLLVESFSTPYAKYSKGTSKMPARLLLEDGRGFSPEVQEKLVKLAIQKLERVRSLIR
jgi:hypothetical protein